MSRSANEAGAQKTMGLSQAVSRTHSARCKYGGKGGRRRQPGSGGGRRRRE
jgi:hypothetical protein